MNKQFLKYSVVLFLTLGLQAKETYSVDDLILKALEKSPDIQISQFEYDASKSRYDDAFSGYLPTLNLHASAGKTHQSETFIPGNIDDTLIVGQLSLKQIIYDFGKTGGNSDTQKFNSESYKMQDLQKISDKKREIKNAYYSLIKAKALIDVQKENVKLNEAQLYRSQKYFEAGIRTKIDVSDAEVRLIKAKLDLKTAQYDLKLAFANLDKVVGFTEIETDYDVYFPELQLDALYETLTDYDLNLRESISYAYENRYELKASQANIKASQAQTTQVTSEYYPSFYFDANYIYQNADKLQALLPENKWSANLNLDWNLYQGGSTSARKQEKIINFNISNAKLSDSKLIIKKNTTNAYLNLNKTKDVVELAQNLLVVSNEKFDQASKRYEHGLSDYIELQEARQGYIDSKATLVIDYYDYYIAIADLDNAIGR